MSTWTFDPSQYQERNFQIIPVGDYRARIEDVVEKTYSTGSQGYEITLQINGHNSRIWYRLVLDASNPTQTNQRIGEFFNSFGITSTAMGTGKQWIGAVGAVRVKHELYNGENTAKVAYVIARNRQEKLPAWKNPSTGATPTSVVPDPVLEIPDNVPFEM